VDVIERDTLLLIVFVEVIVGVGVFVGVGVIVGVGVLDRVIVLEILLLFVFVGVFGWRHGVGVSRLGGCRRL